MKTRPKTGSLFYGDFISGKIWAFNKTCMQQHAAENA